VTDVGIEMFRIRPELTVIVWRDQRAGQLSELELELVRGYMMSLLERAYWYSPERGQGRKDRSRRPCAMSMIPSQPRPDAAERREEPTHHDTVHWPHCVGVDVLNENPSTTPDAIATSVTRLRKTCAGLIVACVLPT
jgi:hypothetical protein